MKDRIVQYPNRFKLEPVSGTTDTFDLTSVPGVVTEAGDDINKANLLPDAVVSVLGLEETNPQVSDALLFLGIGNSRAYVVVTVYETATTTPIPNVLVNGIKTSTGGDVYTDSNGIAAGFTTTATTSIGVNAEYVDLTVNSTSVSTPLGKKTNSTIYATRKTNAGYLETIVASAGYYRFTDKVLVDIHVCGGGENGAGGYTDHGGAGGRGGQQAYGVNKTTDPKTRYQAVVGAGNGGASSFMGVDSGSGAYSGLGGVGYVYNPSQSPTVGGNSTIKKYGTEAVVAGGGGGGGDKYAGGMAGGSPYGGVGASSGNAGGAATGYGGGGGGGYPGGSGTGGAGYQGAIWFRWRYKA